MISGFICLNKPSGISSNKALGILKHALREIDIKEKIGHMGTLDPLATGVLPVAIGRATRLFEYSLEKLKEYEADFILGASSESLDTDMDVTYLNFLMPKREELINAIKTQIGDILQVPPNYSAKSINGVRAYNLARKGEQFQLSPKKVKVDSIELLNIDENKITLKIKCGGGTYIRAICRDIAEQLGTQGVMSKLLRTRSGIFDLNNSVTLQEIESNPNCVFSRLIPMDEFVRTYSMVNVSDVEKKRLLNGLKVNLMKKNGLCAVYNEGTLIGIGQISDSELKVKTWLI